MAQETPPAARLALVDEDRARPAERRSRVGASDNLLSHGDGRGSEGNPAVAVRAHFRVLRRRVLLIAAVVILTVLSAYGVLQFFPDMYVVEARLLVKLGRENTEIPVTVGTGGVVASGVRKEEINSEAALLTAPQLVEEVVDGIPVDAFFPVSPPPTTLVERAKRGLREVVQTVKGALEEAAVALGLAPKLSRRDKAVRGVQNNLKVTRDGDSDVVLIALRLPDQDLAALLVGNLIDLYLVRRIEARRDPKVEGVFDERVALFRRRLGEIEAARDALRRDANVSVVGEERQLLLRRRDEISKLIANARRDEALLAPEGARLAERVAAQSHASIEAVKARIAEIQIERAKLLQRSADRAHPVVELLDREIAHLRGLGLSATDGIIRELSAEVEAIDARIQTLNQSEDKLERLQREYDVAKQHYLVYTKRLEDARIAEELDLRRIANISVLSPPTVPREPASPRRMLIMFISIPVGLMLGISLALLLDYIDPRIRDHRQLERIPGLPYLGTFRHGAAAARRLRRL